MTMYDLLLSKGFTVEMISTQHYIVSLNRKLYSDEVLMAIDHDEEWAVRSVNGEVHLMTIDQAAELGLWDDVEIME